jgi:hypothetical protein
MKKEKTRMGCMKKVLERQLWLASFSPDDHPCIQAFPSILADFSSAESIHFLLFVFPITPSFCEMG